MSVTVGKTDTKPDPQIITSEFMAKLQKKLGCSERKLLMMA